MIDGLKLLLKDQPGFTVVAEANSGEKMLALLSHISIDILLTDIGMNGGMNGLELTQTVKSKYPGLKVLALSMSEDGMMITRMIEQAHVDGYVPKACGQKELLTAIETIFSGGTYFASSVLDQYNACRKILNSNKVIHLTPREIEIIGCIVQHFSNRQIAGQLFISERTVETHRKNIYRKTDTKGEASLIQFVKEHKLIE